MLLYQDVIIYPGICNTNMFMNSICLGRKWAYLNLSCQGVVKEIRIKKHDQNANLCLIIATDSV